MAGDWLERHTGEAPAALRERVRHHLAGAGADSGDPLVLAQASRGALEAVASQPEGGRAIALDLLAADALITLALLAQAQASPSGLEAFAARLLDDLAGLP